MGPMIPQLPHLAALRPVPHGGAAQLASRGLDARQLLDFSATTYPGPTPEAVRAALLACPLAAYPDPGCTGLTTDLAARHGVPAESVLVGNGSVALIHAIARACLAPGHTALVVGPTFGEYRLAIELTGASAVEVHATDVEIVCAAIEEHTPRLLFVCNPNNPTGHLWSAAEIDRLASRAFLVVDEAYAGFLRPEPAPMWGADRIVLRSLTKDRGLAALRVGYAIGAPEALRTVALCLTPWGVGAVAQEAARAALRCDAVYDAALRDLWDERARLCAALRASGFTVEAGAAPFFLVDVGDAAATCERLLGAGIVARDCTSFGLPRHIRISPRTPAEGDRLVAALAGEPMPPIRGPGRIHFVLGGARSGKSTHAERLAGELGGDDVTYVATAAILDDEMRDRVARHRAQRNAAWPTVEAPLHADEAVRDAVHDVVLLDCMTLLASNWLLESGEEAALQAVDALIDAVRTSGRTLVAVSNEVGSGVVPATELGRRFRDLQGLVNRRLMEAADRGVLLVAGQPLSVKGTP